MNNVTYSEEWPDISTALYNRSALMFRAVKKLLSVKFELFADTQMLQGDIFLFNHFSRFETFIPQFLIFEKTGAFSCAIASGEFFKTDTLLSNYLRQVGVYPHDHPRLFAMLAGQILRGRKVIIFPEGGMVKDHRVIDQQGNYSIYSRITGKRRKQHTGPAVLGQGVEALKTAIRFAFREQHIERLQQWKTLLQLDSLDELMAAAAKPTLIVPGNITFYPIRASENLLFNSVELFSEQLSLREAEELLIEGNILLKDTDMDIRLGNPINPCCDWDWRTHYLMDKVAHGILGLDEAFQFSAKPRNLPERLLGYLFIKNAQCSRDQYMEKIYAKVTVNLSHLASTLIMSLLDTKQATINKMHFYTVLYVSIKNLQKNTTIHLHRSLLDPDAYSDLIDGMNPRFEQFICIAKNAELLSEQNDCLHFLPKLCEDHDFDQIRLENPIAVYNNEVAPLRIIRETLLAANEDYPKLNPFQLSAWQFEDEQMALTFEQHTYTTVENVELKLTETAIADPAPFFIKPKQRNGLGILLIHGLLASPAEVRSYGHYLAEQGYTVLGIRLKGHGTSPSALREVSLEDWHTNVRRGFNLLKVHCEKLFVIGFSTGGALALNLAAEQRAEIIGLVVISVPIKFVNPAFMLVPLLHNTNKLVQWVSSLEGIKPYIENVPEHPDINYCNTPVRALYELRRLIEQFESVLPKVLTSTLVLYADQDPIVLSQSAELVYTQLGASQKYLHAIASNRHGILMENISGTWTVIDDFLKQQLTLAIQEASS